MPVSIRKVSGGFQVRTPHAVHATGTTLTKAKAQARLLNAIDHGWTPSKGSKRGGQFSGR